MTPIPGQAGTDLRAWLDAHRSRIVKLADGRLNIPAETPHMEGHNTWCANVAGSTLVFPVADLAQHVILLLLYLVPTAPGSTTTSPAADSRVGALHAPAQSRGRLSDDVP
jgi:hypothetical protein